MSEENAAISVVPGSYYPAISEDPAPPFNIKLDHLLVDGAAMRGIPIRREETSERDVETSLIPIRKEGPEGPYLEWEYVADRHYTVTSTAFTERQLYKHEFYKNLYGDLIDYIPWSRERLENERDALIYIAGNTTIRVPKVLSFSVENDVASLTTALVDGIPKEDAKRILSEEDYATLESNVSSYINDTVLPQLNQLTSNTLGTVRGNLIPPPRLEFGYLPKDWECPEHGDECTEDFIRPRKQTDYGRKRYPWPSVTSATKDYVYCHNDLGRGNIFIDPKTLQVTSITDWGSSGFFPKGFEFPYWRIKSSERVTPAGQGYEDPMIDEVLKVIFGPDKAKVLVLQSCSQVPT